jgi:hypothetical protein
MYKLIYSLLLISFSSFGQIILPVKYGKFNKSSNFNVVEVLDKRLDTTSVGVINSIDGNKKDTITLNKPIPEFFMEMFNKNQNLSPKASNNSVIFKINYMEFNKRDVKKKQRYWVSYDIDVYLKIAENQYVSLISGMRGLEGETEFRKTENLDEIQFWKLNWHFWDIINTEISKKNLKLQNKDKATLSYEQICQMPEIRNIFNEDVLKVGNYVSLNELFNNRPSVELNKYKKPTYEGVDALTGKKNNLVYPNKHYFGHCDGKNIFINYNMTGDFLPLERLGTSFEIAGIAEKVYHKRIENRALQTSLYFSTMTPILANGPLLLSGAILAISIFQGPSETRYVLNKEGLTPFKLIVIIEME